MKINTILLSATVEFTGDEVPSCVKGMTGKIVNVYLDSFSFPAYDVLVNGRIITAKADWFRVTMLKDA